MTPNEEAMARECGRVVLWVGNEAQGWSAQQFADAARFAHAHGVDSLCAKVADGGIKWYGSPANLSAIRDAVLHEGCGFIPFAYLYGMKFGAQQVLDEAGVLKELLSVCPVAQADMEQEWDGQVGAAQTLAAQLEPVPGQLSISTWADPNQQNWQGVIRALDPCVNAWTPQQYTDWLAAQEPGGQLAGMGLTIQPGVDLSPEFGSDHVLNIVQQAIARGHRTVYLWEYQTAQQNTGLVDAVVSAMRAGFPDPLPTPTPSPTPTPTPTPTPAPSPQWPKEHTVVSGDTLSALAQTFYGNGNMWVTIYNANRGIIGGNPNLIKPGQRLTIPAPPAAIQTVAFIAHPSIIE